MKNTFVIFLILFTSKCVSQKYELRISPYIESEIVYKDGTQEKGLVRIANSVFDVRFKTDPEEKEKKISYKDIERIVTNPDSANPRIFQYLETYKNKFRTFVELIHQDGISIYLGASDETELFYSNLDIRSSKAMNTFRTKKSEQSLRLSNGMKILLPVKYNYDVLDNPFISKFRKGEFQAYLDKGENKLIPVEHRKRFLKKYIRYFSECPRFIKAYETEKVDLENLPVFIETYKRLCGTQENEF